MSQVEVLPLVLAGGRGDRLHPLTAKRCKPAVPFGGSFRVIDFTLINCAFSRLRRAYVLTQYLAESLGEHLRATWSSPDKGIEVVALPPACAGQRYLGTADAVYKNVSLIAREQPRDVLVLSGDHVYRADYRRLLESHRRQGADVTVLTGSIDPELASCFGVMTVAGDGRITDFVEKPAVPAAFAKDGKCSINLGIYCFRTRFLLDLLARDAREESSHDFGRNILPAAVRSGRVCSCDLREVCHDPRPYWRDVGTVDSYFEASMDLLGRRPAFDLLSPLWSKAPWLRPWLPQRVAVTARLGCRRVRGLNLLAHDAEVLEAEVVNSILSPQAMVEPGAELEECVLFPGARVGEGARLRRVIVEESVSIPEGAEIGMGSLPRSLRGSQQGVTVVYEGAAEKAAPADGRPLGARELNRSPGSGCPPSLPPAAPVHERANASQRQ